MSHWAQPTVAGAEGEVAPKANGSPRASTLNGSRRREPAESANLEDVSSVKVQFLAVLNHEIRTPLSGIMGMTDLLLETKLDDEQREYISATRACAETLFEVLNATLEYSALSTGKTRLEEAEFHIGDAVSAATAEHQYKAESKGLRLFLTVQPGVPDVLNGDALRLRQLLSHLISNGIKFSSQGEVEVKVSPGAYQDGRLNLVFEVRDTGIGIAADQLARIFDSFRQLDSGLSRAYSGLGLGLALVETLVQLMGGRIWAESAVGQGSSFFVEIPFKVTEVYQQPPPPEVPASPSAARILLVDDNQVAQRIFSHVLRRGKYLVECASSGADAIRAAESRRYDLILMDLQMPGINGFEATRVIRKLPGYTGTPIIALTANSAEEHRHMATESGMQGFLVKPIPSTELLNTVAQLLRQ